MQAYSHPSDALAKMLLLHFGHVYAVLVSIQFGRIPVDSGLGNPDSLQSSSRSTTIVHNGCEIAGSHSQCPTLSDSYRIRILNFALARLGWQCSQRVVVRLSARSETNQEICVCIDVMLGFIAKTVEVTLWQQRQLALGCRGLLTREEASYLAHIKARSCYIWSKANC
jgi:hypothetical protein